VRTWIDRRSLLDAPLPEVWALLTDVGGWPAWTPGLRAIRRRPGALEPGKTRFWMHIEMPPLPALLVPCELEALDEQRIAWGGGVGGSRISHRFELTGFADGRTEVRHVEEASGLLAQVLRPFEPIFIAHDEQWSNAIEARFGASRLN
jgi:Polyketide cyclase / dehydrase and lipid transport